MAVRIVSGSAMTVYEYQNFISRHYINPVAPETGTVYLSSYTITTSASPIGTDFATGVTVSIAGTSLTISGRYERVFIDDDWEVRDAKMSSNISSYDSFLDLPDQYWGITKFRPDLRENITVSINLVTNFGSTSISQVVRNDWSTKRNQLITAVYEGDADKNSTSRDTLLQGPADIDSDEINTAYVFTTSISTNITNYDLYNDALFAGWNGITALLATVTVQAGVYVYATTTSVAGFTVASLPAGSAVNIINNGYILGMGGAGGGDATLAQYNAAAAAETNIANGPGSSGGSAININYPITVTNNSYIAGGGGGGACSWFVDDYYSHLWGSGGGGGAGGGKGGNGINTSIITAGGAGGGIGSSGADGVLLGSGAGGGGRILPGTGGSGGIAYSSWNGKGGGAGGGGGACTDPIAGDPIASGGTGGSANNVGGNPGVYNSYYQGGGGGGGWGAAGATTATLGSGYYKVHGGAGGVGGKAVNLNGYTATFAVTGTVYGAVS